MSLRGLFEWFDALESSIALRESLNAYPILLTAHVVSMCLFAQRDARLQSIEPLEKAEKKDRDAVIELTNQVAGTCEDCHTKYRRYEDRCR